MTDNQPVISGVFVYNILKFYPGFAIFLPYLCISEVNTLKEFDLPIEKSLTTSIKFYRFYKRMVLTLKKYNLCFFLFFFSFSLKAQLIINEVSQGFSGNQEYVELLVVGTPTCTTIPALDLRGYYIDDNNGTYAAGAGMGIAQGCVRFTNDPLWSAIPIGTLILIYNDADLNPDVPAQDLSMSDGNCTLVIPVSNCTLLEKHTTQPNTTASTYPTTGLTACGGWTQLGMANTGDSFHTVDPSGNPIFSVSWGNNSTSTVIYFAGAQGGMVCSMTNATNNNPSTQANWVSQAVAGNQTPGAPNNAANAAWINSMNNSCSVLLPLAVTSTVTNAGCTCNGSATVTPSGAIAPYTYSWSPAGGTAATASALCTGNYSVTVTSSNGCAQTVTLTVNSVSPITTTISASPVLCNGGATGSATVTPANGTGAYTYSWSPSGGTNDIASGLTAGNYTVTVTDGIGCLATASVSVNQPAPLISTPTQTNIACNGGTNGIASVSPGGGSGAYTYSWSPSGGNAATATGLSVGNYTCTVTDGNGCTLDQSFSISEPPALTITPTQTNVVCNGGASGIASVNVSGGTGIYSYTWSPIGGNSSSAPGLPAGNYTVALTDANGCGITQNFILTQAPALTITPTQTNVACNSGTNGAASVSASGGTGAYTYSWSPSGGSSSSASGLSAGNYTCTISDSSACSTIQSFTIGQPAALFVVGNQVNVTCNGGANASASLIVSGGTGAYTYTWTPIGGNASSAMGFSAGTYTCAATDGNGCAITQIFTITEPPVLVITPTQTNVSCNGGINGTASVSVVGGTANYTYIWVPSGGNSASANNLSAGNYTVTVLDANNCVITATAALTEPPALTLTINNTPATCGANNGTASGIVNGGTGPYTYTWIPTGGNAANASNLAAGNYTLNVSDSNSCLVTNTTSLVSTGGASITVTSTSVSCNGGSTGSANANAVGGIGPYTYSWAPSGVNSASATGLNAGNYTVTVTDASACAQTATISITEPSVLAVVLSSTTICSGQSFTLNANVSGGTTPYQYSWNGGASQSQNTFSVAPVASSNYSLTVTDNNGCVSAANIATVNVLPPLNVITGNALVCQGNSANLQALASGGNGNYTYSWMPGNLSGSSVSVNLQSTTIYTVSVSDGCTLSNASDTGLISVVSMPQVTLPPNTSGCAPQCVNFIVANDPAISAWQWNFGDNASASVQNPAHCYQNPGNYNVSLSYTTNTGCSNTVSANSLVTVYSQPNASFYASAYETSIYDPQVSFYDQSTGGANSWQWNFGDATNSSVQNPVHLYTSAGNYYVYLTVANQYGCKDSTWIEIKIKEDFTFYAPNAMSPDGDGLNDLFLPIGMGWDNSSYSLLLFDRWGNEVFSTNDPEKGWDGMKKGQYVQEDTYVWKVELKDIYGLRHQYKGIVSVLR